MMRGRASSLTLLALLACSGSSKPVAVPAVTADAQPSNGSAAADTTADAPVTVGVAISATPADAIVEIDDMRIGAAADLDPVVALAPGLHTLVITREGYKPYRIEFSITDKVEKFAIKLEPKK